MTTFFLWPNLQEDLLKIYFTNSKKVLSSHEIAKFQGKLNLGKERKKKRSADLAKTEQDFLMFHLSTIEFF
jgi:hypothetical protein